MVFDRYRIVFMYVTAALAVFIAIRIEMLNSRAGGVLPHREYRNGDPAERVVTWRESPITDEQRWREVRGPRDAEGKPVSRPLTPDEQQQMAWDVARAQAHNTLRSFVETFGMLQCVLAPVLVLMSVFMIHRRRHSPVYMWSAVPPLLVGLACNLLLFYREYVTSLGW